MTRRSLLAASCVFLALSTLTALAGPMNFGQNAGPMNGDGLLETQQKVLLAIAGQQGAQRVNSTAYEASHVLKATGGSLVFLSGYNSGGAGFIQVFDSATVPADGAAPILVFAVQPNSNFSVDVPVLGLPCATGISACFSSTAPTKTLGGAVVYFTAVVK